MNIHNILRRRLLLGAIYSLGVMALQGPIMAGTVTVSQNGVPYAENNLDRGGDLGGQVLGRDVSWMQFPDFDTLKPASAGEHIDRIFKQDIKRSIDERLARLGSQAPEFTKAPRVYRMLYKGSADTRVGHTTDLRFRVAVTQAGDNAQTVLILPAITSGGISRITGNGEQDFTIVSDNVQTSESFVLAHRDGNRAFVQVYVILGQLKYILARNMVADAAKDLGVGTRITIPEIYQRALRGATGQEAPPPREGSSPRPAAPSSTFTSSSSSSRPRIPAAQASEVNPLVTQKAQSHLYALIGEQWRPFGELQVVHQTPSGEQGPPAEDPPEGGDAPADRGSRGDLKETWARFLESASEGIGLVNDNIPESPEILASITGQWLNPGVDGTNSSLVWHLSERLGLACTRATVQSVVLEYEEGNLQALALPFFAAIEHPWPIAMIVVEPDQWQRLYDMGEGVAVRSFPKISGIGIPLLREVRPENPPPAQETFAWYALSPELLQQLNRGIPQVLCCFLVHSQGMEMHLTLLQRKLPGEDAVVIPEPDVPEPEEPEPSVPPLPIRDLWMDLAGVRLLELRYLAKVHSNIQWDSSYGCYYQVFLRLLNLAHHNRVYYTYEPDYNSENSRFGSWRLQDDHGQPLPFIIPYVQRVEFSTGGEPVVKYYDFWASREARSQAGKAEKLSLESMQNETEPEDIATDMNSQGDLFTAQWLDEDSEAYGILREMKAKVIETIQSDPNLAIQTQMLDLDWWAYRDQLFGAKGRPELGKEFQAVCTEAVRPEEAQEGESDVF